MVVGSFRNIAVGSFRKSTRLIPSPLHSGKRVRGGSGKHDGNAEGRGGFHAWRILYSMFCTLHHNVVARIGPSPRPSPPNTGERGSERRGFVWYDLSWVRSVQNGGFVLPARRGF